MKYLLKKNMISKSLYLGPASTGNLRGPLSNAYAFSSYKDASWLRNTMGLKSRYDIVEISAKALFEAKLKGK